MSKEYKFKGTPAPWFAEHYANYTNIQPEEGYVDNKGNPVKNLLDIEDCAEAVYNGHLVAAAPDLLSAAIRTVQSSNPLAFHDNLELLTEAIEKALNIKNDKAE